MDHASSVDEAVDIALQYNICCPNSRSLGVHVLVADPTGHSVILELHGGQLRIIPNTQPWQVLTNSPVYQVPIETQRLACGRFNYIFTQLETAQGTISVTEAENLLSIVGNPYTQWSAVYRMSTRAMVLFLDYDFTEAFHFSLSE